MKDQEFLSRPLFVKKKLQAKRKPKSTVEILKEAQSHSSTPKGEPNYWGADKTIWRKK
jgi:hypothetical protein